jgi:hypothetical protein
MKAIVRCISDPYPKDYVHVILSNETNEYLMSATFLRYSQLDPPLEERGAYRLGKGVIKSNMDHHHYHSSYCELEFDCSKSLIEAVECQSQEVN